MRTFARVALDHQRSLVGIVAFGELSRDGPSIEVREVGEAGAVGEEGEEGEALHAISEPMRPSRMVELAAHGESATTNRLAVARRLHR